MNDLIKKLQSFETIPYVYLISVWGININDLIRGEWFYHSIPSVIVLNLFGILSLWYIISYKKQEKKDEKDEVS